MDQSWFNLGYRIELANFLANSFHCKNKYKSIRHHLFLCSIPILLVFSGDNSLFNSIQLGCRISMDAR